jgi:hypothetical protein
MRDGLARAKDPVAEARYKANLNQPIGQEHFMEVMLDCYQTELDVFPIGLLPRIFLIFVSVV